MSKYAKSIENAAVVLIKLAMFLSFMTAFLTGCWRL